MDGFPRRHASRPRPSFFRLLRTLRLTAALRFPFPAHRRSVGILLLAGLAASPATAQTPGVGGPGAAASPLAAAWEARVAAGEIGGVVSLIVVDGEVLAADSAGITRPGGPPMGLGSRVRIASMTKPVTSVAAMILVEEGVLALDAPISRWLPEFAALTLPDGEPARGGITVEHLLTHRAGFTYGFLDRGPVGEAYRRLGVRDAGGVGSDTLSQAGNMRRLAQAPLASEPGGPWRYGLSTDVLGHLVEVASGLPLDVFFRTRIFEPLGMTETDFHVDPSEAEHLAATWARPPGGELVPVPGSDRPGRVALLSGGAGLVSTARDYARFAHMLLGEGALDGARILRPETVRAMTTSRTDDLVPPPLGPGRGFGLGFRVEADGAFGWDGIYGTTFTVSPATRSFRILMLQHAPRNPGGIERAFAEEAEALVAEAVLATSGG